MKYFKVRIVVGTSDSTFDIYYDSVNSGTRALLYDTGLPAIGLTNEVLETGEGVTVSVPDEASSIVLSSSPTAFCGDGTTNDSTFSIPLGCISYTVSSSAGVFNYYYTDCNCIPVSATLDATYGYTEQTFCALQDSVNSGLLTIVDNGICLDTYEITYTNNISTQSIQVLIGNNAGSPSNTVYNGLYTSDPLIGTSIELPAVNAIVVLSVPDKTITSATCNGVTQTGAGNSITWYNVNGPLVINFVTTPIVVNYCGVWTSSVPESGDIYQNYIDGYLNFLDTMLPGETIVAAGTNVDLASYSTLTIDQTFTGPFGVPLSFSDGSTIGSFGVYTIPQGYTNSNPAYSLRFSGTILTDYNRTIPVDITSLYGSYTESTNTSSKNDCNP